LPRKSANSPSARPPAAKEIKTLIGNSEAAVNQGVVLVNDTGDGLKEIAKLVAAVNQHMEAIAIAANEQALGLSEINTSVNHMDQMTQQNAAMVEENSKNKTSRNRREGSPRGGPFFMAGP
jgi:methyl-accepting chemotaxis protein